MYIANIDNKEEIAAVSRQKNRALFHLMPPMGWMNDPNGLCFYKGFYHVFFQYSPDNTEYGLKCWGHYRSRDLLRWEYLGIPIKPDCPADRNGAFSGCAFTDDGLLEIFYTGNMELEGDYDYTYSGREANIIYIKSEDGVNFSEKQVLLGNKDYPKGYTCHIRDPKVWKQGDGYYMVLGARKGAPGETEDFGTVLLYHSPDKLHWKFEKEITCEERFGYMWECPDYFTLDGVHVLAACPQGIEKETYRFSNMNLAGYFITEDITEKQADCTGKAEHLIGTGAAQNTERAGVKEKAETKNIKQNFIEWDRGFDFYAPQTFEDENGRRILIGWAGVFSQDYTNQTTIAEGWQHCLTVPRVLTVRRSPAAETPGNAQTGGADTDKMQKRARTSGADADEMQKRARTGGADADKLRSGGKITLLQNPVEELKQLRTDSVPCDVFPVQVESAALDAVFTFADGTEEKKISLGGDLEVRYKDGVTELAFCGDAGEGRDFRRVITGELRSLRILKDKSVVECYGNDGEFVFTTKFYPKAVDSTSLNVVGRLEHSEIWKLAPVEILW